MKKYTFINFMLKNRLKIGAVTTLSSAILGLAPSPKNQVRVYSQLSGSVKKIGNNEKIGNKEKIRNFQYKHVPYEMIVKFKDHMSTEEIEAFLKPHDAYIVHRYTSNGACLVRVTKNEVSALATS